MREPLKFDGVITIDVGNDVFCDLCGGDYTNLPDSGGVLFGSYAACPKCTPKLIADAAADGELKRIKAKCPEGVSFADWVRNELRKPLPKEYA